MLQKIERIPVDCADSQRDAEILILFYRYVLPAVKRLLV
jgi:hypothetical protein